jgi:hypothetical protein
MVQVGATGIEEKEEEEARPIHGHPWLHYTCWTYQRLILNWNKSNGKGQKITL